MIKAVIYHLYLECMSAISCWCADIPTGLINHNKRILMGRYLPCEASLVFVHNLWWNKQINYTLIANKAGWLYVYKAARHGGQFHYVFTRLNGMAGRFHYVFTRLHGMTGLLHYMFTRLHGMTGLLHHMLTRLHGMTGLFHYMFTRLHGMTGRFHYVF